MAELSSRLPKTQDATVPEGIRLARATFLRDFPALLSDRKTRGRFVVYHKDRRVAVARHYFSAIDEVNLLDLPDGEFLIFKVTPSAGREQQEIADEAEMDLA